MKDDGSELVSALQIGIEGIRKMNVADKYKGMAHEDIVADLNKKRNNFSILCVNIEHDFNLSTVVRNNNAFLGKEIFIYGRRRYDRRGCVGTYLYENITYLPEDQDLDRLFARFDCVVGIDNTAESVGLSNFQWKKDKKYLLCFGQESLGLPPEILYRCDYVVEIEQLGSVRSLNVSNASAIVFYDYCKKTGVIK